MLNEKSLINKDINLLLLLVILHDEKNTVKTAERLFVTQSAISKGLKKLREQLNDPLFVRTREGFVPTEKCEYLVEKVTPLLIDLEGLYAEFNNQKVLEYAGEISIAINSGMYYTLADDIYFTLKKDFPSASIKIINWSESTEQHLLNSKIQIGINYHPLEVSKDISQQVVIPVSFRLLARSKHPLEGKSVNLKDIAQYPLVVSVMPNFTNKISKIELALAKLKLGSKIILRSDDAHLSLTTLKRSEAIMPVNELLAQKAGNEFITLDTSFSIDSYMPSTQVGLFCSNKFAMSKLGKSILNSIEHTLKGLN